MGGSPVRMRCNVFIGGGDGGGFGNRRGSKRGTAGLAGCSVSSVDGLKAPTTEPQRAQSTAARHVVVEEIREKREE
jgi:hypothetical protein